MSAATDFKTKVIDFMTKMTWGRLALYVVTAAFAISMYTLWENRQQLFTTSSRSLNGTIDDFILETPGKVGEGMIRDFLKAHPSVLMISMIDANPIANERKVVYRDFNSARLKSTVETQVAINPTAGDGPLFNADETNNKQILAILNGEFTCSPVRPQGPFGRAYPDLNALNLYQCRVPLPPAFGKATGWFSLIMEAAPPSVEVYDQLKIESLLLSLNYYNLEILKQATRTAR